MKKSNCKNLYKSGNENKFSDEELVRDWTLHEKDLDFIKKYRKQNRQNIAIQLCAIRLYGRIFNNYSNLSPQVINYINQQLGFPPALYVAPSDREGTYIDHRKNIFTYLGFVKFNNKARSLLKTWLAAQLKNQAPLVDEMLPKAEQFLISKKFILPGITKLRRFINSIISKHQQNLFEQIYSKLTPQVKDAIDTVLTVQSSEQKSQFNIFKEYPPSATV